MELTIQYGIFTIDLGVPVALQNRCDHGLTSSFDTVPTNRRSSTSLEFKNGSNIEFGFSVDGKLNSISGTIKGRSPIIDWMEENGTSWQEVSSAIFNLRFNIHDSPSYESGFILTRIEYKRDQEDWFVSFRPCGLEIIEHG